MSRVFITSDLHFGHRNMAQIYRGFKDEFHHDETIIKNWNSVVHKKDKVYILGDITMETNKWYFLLDQLNGRKVVVLGNHDDPKHTAELLNYVDQVSGMIKYKGYWLTHAPIHPYELRGHSNIHGHIHGNHIMEFGDRKDRRYINACLDVHNYTPVLFTDLIKGYE
jgi:calcineurin-like phosphoesterase family protein